MCFSVAILYNSSTLPHIHHMTGIKLKLDTSGLDVWGFFYEVSYGQVRHIWVSAKEGRGSTRKSVFYYQSKVSFRLGMNTRNYDQGFIYQSLYTEILTEKVFKYKNSVPQKMVKALYGKKPEGMDDKDLEELEVKK